MGWSEDTRPYDAFPKTGKLCSVCGLPQHATPGGDVCAQGHGGAPSIDPPKEAVQLPAPAVTLRRAEVKLMAATGCLRCDGTGIVEHVVSATAETMHGVFPSSETVRTICPCVWVSS